MHLLNDFDNIISGNNSISPAAEKEIKAMSKWDKKIFEHIGNKYNVIGTSVNIYYWNSGKNQTFLVTAGYKNSDHVEKTIPGKGPEAREKAINLALSIKDKYLL